VANRERNLQIKFYVNDEEKNLIEDNMKEANIKNMGAYLRKMAIDGHIFILDNMPLREMNTNMTRFSINMNQIAKRVNSTSNIYAEDLEEIKEMMKDLWQLQKSILSKLP